MKTIDEIQALLVSELLTYKDEIKSASPVSGYYNQALGNTSFLLAGLLEALLRVDCEDWDTTKWIDDCLIIKLEIKNDILMIWGVMIWGKDNTTEQWTDPFFFQMGLIASKSDFKKLTFLFCDLDNNEMSYDEFRNNRNYWNIKDRSWKYILNSESKQRPPRCVD